MHLFPPSLKGTYGTSLAEVLITLGLVSVVTALAAHSLLAILPRAERSTATAEFAVEIRAAHRLAIAQRVPVRVSFDGARGVLHLQHADHPAQVFGEYEYGRRGISAVMLSRGTSVVFYPSGRAASPVTITLRTRRGETSKITVSITGKVAWS